MRRGIPALARRLIGMFAMARERSPRPSAARAIPAASNRRSPQVTHAAPAAPVKARVVGAARLDEAEAAARDLLVRFPDVHDGWDRLGMVHEARGDSRQAADCYRKVIDFIRQHPDDYDAATAEQFARLVDKLDPPVAT